MLSDRRTFFIPIPSLGVPDGWRVGRVVFYLPTNAQQVVDEHAETGSAGLYLHRQATEILGKARNGCVAKIADAVDVDDARDTLRGSIDALQLFQLARRMSQTTSFGLPGDIYESRVRYVQVSEGPGIGVGGTHRGDHPGWRFDIDSMNDWSRSAGFQFLDRSLQSGPVTEGTRRAVLGARLLVRAAREHQTDLKMLGVVSALEAWLLTRSRGTQSLLLAQRLAWFGCGRPTNSLCGRDRPVCPYIHLDPGATPDRRRLRALRELGNSAVAWRCSEWHQVMDWYDARSGPAHGDDPSAVSPEVAKSAEFWVTHYLTEPILEWLGDHQQDPVGDLEQALHSIEDPAGWVAMLGALDSATPPAAPPVS